MPRSGRGRFALHSAKAAIHLPLARPRQSAPARHGLHSRCQKHRERIPGHKPDSDQLETLCRVDPRERKPGLGLHRRFATREPESYARAAAPKHRRLQPVRAGPSRAQIRKSPRAIRSEAPPRMLDIECEARVGRATRGRAPIVAGYRFLGPLHYARPQPGDNCRPRPPRIGVASAVDKASPQRVELHKLVAGRPTEFVGGNGAHVAPLQEWQ